MLGVHPWDELTPTSCWYLVAELTHQVYQRLMIYDSIVLRLKWHTRDISQGNNYLQTPRITLVESVRKTELSNLSYKLLGYQTRGGWWRFESWTTQIAKIQLEKNALGTLGLRRWAEKSPPWCAQLGWTASGDFCKETCDRRVLSLGLSAPFAKGFLCGISGGWDSYWGLLFSSADRKAIMSCNQSFHGLHLW